MIGGGRSWEGEEEVRGDERIEWRRGKVRMDRLIG